MKLLLAVMLFASVFASNNQDRTRYVRNQQSFDLVGQTRNLSLYAIGAHLTGRLGYIKLRIELQRGKILRMENPILIFNNIFEAKDDKYNITVGWPTLGMPSAVNTIRSHRIHQQENITFDYSGTKRGLFEQVFTYINNYPVDAEKKLTGEVRFIINHFKTDLRNITATVQYIVE